jgi:hypothetical protein
MVIMSHLSDLQEEIGTSKPAQAFYMTTKLNFVKYLIHHYKDTSVEINPDVVFEKFNLWKKDIEARELKDQIFDLVEKDVDNWTELFTDQYLENEDQFPPKTLIDKKKLVLDLEYNYIMQSSIENLKSVYHEQYAKIQVAA